MYKRLPDSEREGMPGRRKGLPAVETSLYISVSYLLYYSLCP